MENPMRLACYLMLPALRGKQAVEEDKNPVAAARGDAAGGTPAVALARVPDSCHIPGDAPTTAVLPAPAPSPPLSVGADTGAATPGTPAAEQAIEVTAARPARGPCVRAYSPATLPCGPGRGHRAVAALSPARRRRRAPAG